jgi:hypothetical protein
MIGARRGITTKHTKDTKGRREGPLLSSFVSFRVFRGFLPHFFDEATRTSLPATVTLTVVSLPPRSTTAVTLSPAL